MVLIMARSLGNIYKPLWFSSEISVSLDYIEDELEHNATNMSPPYQRGDVWTLEQRERFMGHLLQGGEVQPIVFHRTPDQRDAEVIDGKQRLTSIRMWLNDEIGARFDDGSLVKISELEQAAPRRGKFRPKGISRINVRFRYIDLPFEQRKLFYVRLNSAGTPHTPEQLRAALEAKEVK